MALHAPWCCRSSLGPGLGSAALPLAALPVPCLLPGCGRAVSTELLSVPCNRASLAPVCRGTG